MKPFAVASKDNYFDPLSSGSSEYQPQYLVALLIDRVAARTYSLGSSPTA